MLTGDVHCAIETEAAVHALEKGCTPITPVLVLPAAAHSVLGHSARRNLHLVHFWRGEEMECEPLPHSSVSLSLYIPTHALTHAQAFPPTPTSRDVCPRTQA